MSLRPFWVRLLISISLGSADASLKPSADDASLFQVGSQSDSGSIWPRGELLIYDDVLREHHTAGDKRPNYAYLTFWYETKPSPGSLLGRGEGRDVQKSKKHARDSTASSPIGVTRLADALLNVGAKYPLAVATNSQELIKSLKNYSNVEIVRIEKRHELKEQERCDKKNHMQKLWLFGLPRHDKYLYMDADVEVRENVDGLFDEDLDGGRKVRVQQDDYKCLGENSELSELVCSGVMLFQPSKALQAGLIAESQERPHWKGDQDIIESFLRRHFDTEKDPKKKALGFRNLATGAREQYKVGFFPQNIVSFSKCNPNASLSHHDHNGKK